MIRPLIEKEVKDLLRDPRILLPFILGALILPVIGFVISIPMRTAIEEAVAGTQTVGLLDLDNSYVSAELVAWLEQHGIHVVKFAEGSWAALREEAMRRGINVVVILPEGFGEAVLQRRAVNITFLNIVEELSMFGAPAAALVANAIEDYVSTVMLRGAGIDPSVIRKPVRMVQYTFLTSKGVELLGDPAMLAGLSLSTFFVPFIVISIALTIMQMTATSMAVENEEKTFETLLTLPVPARDIFLAKLLGTFAVALLGSVLQLAGMAAYFLIFMTQLFQLPGPEQGVPAPGSSSQPAVDVAPMFTAPAQLINPQDLGFLAASLLLSLFFCAALGVVVGALSKDVRIASTVVSPLAMLILIPSYFIVFTSSKAMNPLVRAVLYSLPFTQPAILSKEMVAYRLPPELPAYLLASLALTLLVIFLTSRLLSLETLSRLQRSLAGIIAPFKRR